MFYCCSFFILLCSIFIGYVVYERETVFMQFVSSENLLIQKLLTAAPVPSDVLEFRESFVELIDVFVPILTNSLLNSLNEEDFVDFEVKHERQVMPARELPHAKDFRYSIDIFKPKTLMKPPFITVVYIHGGWWSLEYPKKATIPTLETITKFLTVKANQPIQLISINYRLSPENPFPAALYDVEDTLDYLRKYASSLNVDIEKIIITGESAGANLATVFALYDKFEPKLAHLGISIPVFDVSDGWRETQSYQDWQDSTFSDALNQNVVRAYCSPPRCEVNSPKVSPLRASDEQIRNLPPTVLVTHGRDIFFDAAERFSQRMSAVGVPLEHVRHKNMLHSTIRRNATEYLHSLIKSVENVVNEEEKMKTASE